MGPRHTAHKRAMAWGRKAAMQSRTSLKLGSGHHGRFLGSFLKYCDGFLSVLITCLTNFGECCYLHVPCWVINSEIPEQRRNLIFVSNTFTKSLIFTLLFPLLNLPPLLHLLVTVHLFLPSFRLLLLVLLPGLLHSLEGLFSQRPALLPAHDVAKEKPTDSPVHGPAGIFVDEKSDST